MRVYQSKVVTKNEYQYTTCDFCSRKIEDDYLVEPLKGCIDEVMYECDICVDCFKAKLLPWIHSQTVVCRTREYR
jgi:hypothetical protein